MKAYDLQWHEYGLIDTVFQLSINDNSKKFGWCYMSKDKLAAHLHLSRRCVFDVITKAVQQSLLIRDKQGHLQTTDIWNQHYITALDELNHKLANQMKLSLAKIKQTEIDFTAEQEAAAEQPQEDQPDSANSAPDQCKICTPDSANSALQDSANSAPYNNNTDNNTDNKSNVLEQRKEIFKKSIMNWQTRNPWKYPPDMLNQFYLFWTETSTHTATPVMRYEKQEFFDLTRRLSTWWQKVPDDIKERHWKQVNEQLRKSDNQ